MINWHNPIMMVDFLDNAQADPVPAATFFGKEQSGSGGFFGGPEPNGWLKSLEIVTDLSHVSTATMTLEMPFENAKRFLKHESLRAKECVFRFKMGYPPSHFTPYYYLSVRELPQISFSDGGGEIVFKASVGIPLIEKKLQRQYYDKDLFSVVE